MKSKIGIIGTGNMGGAIIRGISDSACLKEFSLEIYDIDTESVKKALSCNERIKASASVAELVADSDIIIIAVKPDIYHSVLDEMKSAVSSSKIIVSIAAGLSISFVEDFFNLPVKVVRTMPNTPLLAGEGMTAVCGGNHASPEDVSQIVKIFGSLGLTEVIDEKYFDIFTALAGSSPAYIYMLIEAMADGGVLEGIPRKTAYRIVSQAVKGAAEMVLRTDQHPGELKDMVCSPGGTTIEAVASLEKDGIRSSMIEAVRKCAWKSRNMGK